MIVGSPTILNLVPGGVMKCVHVNQVNKNIEIQFKVMNGAAPYNVPEGVTCTIRGTKGDAFGYAAEAAVTVGSNVITVTLTEQLTAVAGAGNIFELVFVGAADDMKVSTENFILAVERQAMGEDTVISDSDLSYAEQVLDSLQNVAAVNAQVQQNKTNLAAEISRAQAAEAAEAAARQAADNTLQSNINAEASTRATQDASLQAQIDQLIAPSGSAPSAAEIENARVGADGTTYPTLGDAIRTQVTDVKSAISPLANGTTALTPDYTCVGYYYNPTTNAAAASANFETLKYNVPDECIALVIHSNFYASRIVLANDDSTAASFPSLSFGTVLKYPNAAPASPTDVDITIDLTTVGDYKYIYVPHYVGNHDAVTVSAITRGQVSMLEYYKVDSAGRKRKQVMTGDDIFTTEGFTSGYILISSASGITTQENANYGYTDYIDIKDVGFVLEGMGNTAFSVIYNESKQVVGTGAISNFLDTSGRPDGTKYIRFNVALSVLSSVKMLTYNIEWETYIKPSQVYGGYTDITVGTGKQYTSIVSAVEYANSIASNENTVNVYIYPGTYDVIGDYDLSEQTENWVGLTLADHVNLIGVGSPDDIVLVGELPEDISGYAITRNNVSTLNFWKNNSIKNLTITAKNMRYCLHNEDGKVYAVEDAIEIIKNCKFIYYERDPGATYISMIPVGIGATAGRKTTFSHCVFDNQCSSGNYPLLLHNNTTTEKYCEWTFDACDFVGGTMNSLKLSSSGSGQMEIVNIVGCRLPKNIRFDRQGVYTGTACEYKVYGHGNAISGTESWDGVVEDASVTEMLI